MKNERYYYSIMKPEERKAYRLVYEGLRVRSGQIDVPARLLPDEVQEVYLRVLFDDPLLYYVNQTVIRAAGQFGHYVLLPEYLYSLAEINSINRQLSAVLERIGRKAHSFRQNEFRLEKYLHDSVVKSVAYDYAALQKSGSGEAHSIVGAFLRNRAVCEGTSKAFKLLCNEYGIKCIVVIGKADPAGQFAGRDLHAWNLVKVQGESYHVDATWDTLFDRGSGPVGYDYFNLTTEEILLDHRPIGELPVCTATRLNYFCATKSIVRSYWELVALLTQRIRAGWILFRADTDGGEFLTPEELHDKTLRAVTTALQSQHLSRRFALAFNDLHRIGKVFFDP